MEDDIAGIVRRALRRRLLLAQDARLDVLSDMVAADVVDRDQLGDRVVDPGEAILAPQKQPLPDRFELVIHRSASRPSTVGPTRRGLWATVTPEARTGNNLIRSAFRAEIVRSATI
jgi:hypothetical protein